MRLLCSLLFSLVTLVCYSQEWKGFSKIEGERCENVSRISTIPGGDVIVTGIYEDEAGCMFSSKGSAAKVIKPQADTFPNSDATLYIARYTPSGKLVWAINAFAEAGINPWDMTTDLDGNILVCGNFRGKVIFHSIGGKEKAFQGLVEPKRQGLPPLQYYLVKYSPKGKLLWAKMGVSQDNSVGLQVKTDAQRNVYCRAYCTYSSIGFDEHTLMPKYQTEDYIYNFTLIVLKYNPEGHEEWITYGGGVTVQDMAVSPQGEVSLYSAQNEKMKLFTTRGEKYHLEVPKFNNYFWARTCIKLDKEGRPVVVKPFLPSMPDATIQKTVVDTSGNLYALLIAYPNEVHGLDFKLAWKDTVYKTQSYDIFLAKFDSLEHGRWICQIGGKAKDKPLDICMDNHNHVIISGWYEAATCIRGTMKDSVVLKCPLKAMFVASYSPEGALDWASNCGEFSYHGYTEYLDLAVSKQGYLFAGGLINRISPIGKFKVPMVGPVVNWVSSDSTLKLSWYQYTDGFWMAMDLQSITNDSSVVHPYHPPVLPQLAVSSVADTTGAHQQDLVFIKDRSANQVLTNPLGTRTNELMEDWNIILYPNPVVTGQDNLIVQIDIQEAETIDIIVWDALGQQLQSRKDTMSAGVHTMSLSTQGYPAGAYFVEFHLGKHRQVKKFVIQ